jgi:hypothetical protein
LSILLLKELFNPLCLDVTGATVLSPHQDLPLEVICILSDFGDGHIGFLEDCPKGFQDGVGFDPSLLNGFL